MLQKLYWLGNVAKSRVIADILANSQDRRSITVFDYGCGDGGDWPAILSDHPHLRLVGYEPSYLTCRMARARLQGLAADIFCGNEIVGLSLQADYIVSFSVLEHVVNRLEFLGYAKRILAPEGIFYLNYDDGHFRCLLDLSRPATWMPACRSWARTVLSRPLASVGRVARYQRRVVADEVESLAIQTGFRIDRIDYHNLACLKELAKTIPVEKRQKYTRWWLEIEADMNDQFMIHLSEMRYGDDVNLWHHMLSRTMCLRHA